MSEIDKILKTIGYIAYVIPIVFIVIALPLAFKMVAPNGTYGFRTPKTFTSDQAWYSINSVGGISFIIAGLVSVVLIYAIQNIWKGNQIAKLIASFSVPIILLIPAVIAPLVFV